MFIFIYDVGLVFVLIGLGSFIVFVFSNEVFEVIDKEILNVVLED